MAADQTLQNYDILPANNHPQDADDGSDSGLYPLWQVLQDLEANLRLFTTTAEWVSYLGINGFSVGFVNATTANLGSQNYTANWRVGRRVKAIGVAGGPIYGTIATSVFGGGIMTVTVVWDSGALDAGLTDLQLALAGPQASGLLNALMTGVSAGTDTYTTQLTPSPSSLAALAGVPIFVRFGNANTGAAATLAPNGFAATPIKKYSGGSLVALAAGDIPAGEIAMLAYDGTQFQLLTIVGGGGVVSGTVSDAVLANTYLGTTTPAVTAYSQGVIYLLNFTQANTGGPVIVNLNGIGPLTLKKNVTTDLIAGDISAGQVIACAYDGTNLQALGGINTHLAGGFGTANISAEAATVGLFANVATAQLVLTAPAGGGPFRLVVSYYAALIGGGQDSPIDVQVSDGSHIWANNGIFVSAGKDSGIAASDVSPTTYAPGAAVTINLQSWANHAMTIGGVSGLSGAQSYIKAYFIPST